ncbi:E3 ubiquitin-protein ligase MPSR1-like [Telopea speciosissima]|uniref:E3 ubiquitin-protein ligase MPSR1-like n=1 Tax=Telopea speciosissima TaxID=54955 RepID=UPI001CC4E6D8|nr:E3 ubiquitin-protein ligase MPSR1-like [Telopea speciosissima]
MAANPDEESSLTEQLASTRSRELSLLLPLILGLAGSPRRESDNTDSDQETGARSVDRIILINPITQGTIVIEGGRNLESLLRDSLSKEGLPPASKASIEAMPKMEITQEDLDKECSICLEGWEIGEEAREMPCKHRFHSSCIEKWLGMHGSCPLCRFKMPTNEEEYRKRGSGDGDGDGDGEDEQRRERRGERREIWVTFSFSNNNRGGNRNSTNPATESSDPSDSSSLNPSVTDHETSNNSNHEDH